MTKTFAALSSAIACMLLVAASPALGKAQKATVSAKSAGPTASFTIRPSKPVVGQKVRFRAKKPRCRATPCKYTWVDDGPDGPRGTQRPLGKGRTLAKVFRRAGTKYVRLTVKDRKGRRATVRRKVVVKPRPSRSPGRSPSPSPSPAPSPGPSPAPAPSPSPATCSAQAFCGDWETGSYSQWWLHQWSINRNSNQNYTTSNVGNSKLTIQTSTVKQGKYAGMFQVLPTSGSSSSDRAEAVATQAQSGGYPGQEWYYGWWTYLPSVNGGPQNWWNKGGDWNAITQFQSTDNAGAIIGLGINAADYNPPRLQIKGGPTGRTALGEVKYDHWYHFVVRARWATDSSGLFELWMDGAKVMSVTGATLKKQTSAGSGFTNPGMYLSQGVYRGAHSSTNTVIHDGFCRAGSYAAADAC